MLLIYWMKNESHLSFVIKSNLSFAIDITDLIDENPEVT
jgi:hypothetical protein